MSQVKIQGDVGGTGTITLAAPNTNTNRTINLPDTSGTVVTADAAGNVGINTTAPSSLLHLATSSTAGAVQTFERTNTSIFGGEYYGRLSFKGNDSSAGASGERAYMNVETGGPNGESAIAFGTAGTNTAVAERARIDSSGNLLVGTTSQPVSTYRQVIHYSANSAHGGIMFNDTDSGQTYEACYFRKDGTQRGYIRVTASGTTYATVSDYRLKTEATPMTGALSKVMALNPCTYKWKETGKDGQGFIAHELQAVVPDCVTGEKDAVDEEGNPKYQGIDTSFLVATLTAAIQELNAKVQALEARLASDGPSNTTGEQ